jgi:hypothetical protein
MPTIPQSIIARFLRPVRVAPLRLAAKIPTATADRIVATTEAMPDRVSMETYLLAVAIVVLRGWDPAARHERGIVRALAVTAARRTADAAPWDRPGLRGARLESAGSIRVDAAGAIVASRTTWIAGDD